jgi:hypothetical protein
VLPPQVLPPAADGGRLAVISQQVVVVCDASQAWAICAAVVQRLIWFSKSTSGRTSPGSSSNPAR